MIDPKHLDAALEALHFRARDFERRLDNQRIDPELRAHFVERLEATRAAEAALAAEQGETYTVICRDDRLGGLHYVLGTRQVFTTEAAAQAYADTIDRSREPIIVPGRWNQLRPATYTPRFFKETTR